jgi:ssDNA-binding Zn-finger/Zn-ribbon topoisomerase 1
MKHAAEPRIGGPTIFEKSCAYCGARFRVLARQGRFARQLESYTCPECGKQYETEAGQEPEVELLHPRLDGKTDQYQDTMF